MRFLAFWLFLPSLAFADELWITVSTISHHFNTEQKFNERNPGIGVEYGYHPDKFRLIAGEYTNSFKRHSTYFGGLITPVAVWGVKFGIILGMVNGYPINDGRFTPAATLVAVYETHGVGINLLGTPKITDITPMTMALQVKMKF